MDVFKRLRRGGAKAPGLARPGRGTALSVAGALTLAACAAGAVPAMAGPAPAAIREGGSPAMRPACPPARTGFERCFALFAPQVAVNAAIAAGASGLAATPAGWGATDIASAYKLPVTRNPHQTVAVVEVLDTPALAADLAVYRTQYGLPACTVADRCLRIVNQHGKTAPLPPSGVGSGSDVETMLDVAMVSAACPRCRILVVEANSAGFADLATAEDSAARLGAPVISNSYGAREFGGTQAYSAAYDHPGHVIVASSGDAGFTAANFPANLATVVAAGGTELARARNARGWSERVWNIKGVGASGSGCSAYVAKPFWQHDQHCPGRTVADVSALAWNIAFYEKAQGGWLTAGGTSASAPLIAGIYALAGNASKITPGHAYRHAGSLFDITKGNNIVADLCGRDYLCAARKGYDAPTGLGTPDGTSAF